MWSNPTDELLILTLPSASQFVADRVTDQLECPCWTGPKRNGRGWPGLMNLDVYASHTWRFLGTMMRWRKNASQQRQCKALAIVLLWNFGSCHSYGCYFDMCHLPKNCCKPCTPLHGNGISWWLCLLSALPQSKQWFRNGLVLFCSYNVIMLYNMCSQK